MIKRQAKIDALNIAMDLLNREIAQPTGLSADYSPEDRRKVQDYLDLIVRDLESKRDDAAYRQYIIDDRKAQRLEFLKRK